MNKISNISLSLIIELLSTPECVYLDFKSKMYKIQNSDKKLELIQRKEFIKDVLGLINNKTIENNNGRAYIIIGVEEENGKYNGKHNYIEFDNSQLLIQLKNELIIPHFDINQTEFYLSSKTDEFDLSLERINNYDRCLLLTLVYQKGTVYELKKKIGNTSIDIPYYYKGTSFTRDGSHTRRITQEDRERILKHYNKRVEEKINEYKTGKYLFDLIQELLEYLESKQYWDNKERKDEKINTKILSLIDNIEDLRKYFGINIINEERGYYNKKITILEGRFIITFRNSKPFESFIDKKGSVSGPIKLYDGETSASDIKDLIYYEIKTKLKSKYNLTI